MAKKVDFTPENFDSLINSQGVKVMWEEALFCPCIGNSRGSSQPDFNCTGCNGSGFLYLPPRQTRVFVANFASQKEFQNVGMLDRGTAYMTSSRHDVMGYHDRVTFKDYSSKYSEVVKFTDGTSEKTFREVKRLITLSSIQDVYNVENFEVSEDKRYIADTLAEIPEGTDVSVLYMTSPSYIILDLLHELRATYVKFKKPEEEFMELPKQYLIKREDFVYGQSGDTN